MSDIVSLLELSTTGEVDQLSLAHVPGMLPRRTRAKHGRRSNPKVEVEDVSTHAHVYVSSAPSSRAALRVGGRRARCGAWKELEPGAGET